MLAGLAVGCASDAKTAERRHGPDTRLIAAQPEADANDSDEVVEVPMPVSAPQLRPLPDSLSELGRQQMEPLRAIADGRDSAVMDAADIDGLRAVLRYPYTPGVVYTAVTSPGYVTTIELQPGEQLLTAAAGDTTRWVVESVKAGPRKSPRNPPEAAATLILIKPRQPFLQTNLVITTDQRVYHLDLTSVDVPVYNTAIAWDYPREALIALRRERAERTDEQTGVVESGVAVDALHFDYLVKAIGKASRRPPRWMPTRVFDDGRKTYIEFPPNLGTTEAPPLFVLAEGDEDAAQLVNYRVRGGFYVVDRLFDRAELRLGSPPAKPIVVRIERNPPDSSSRRRPARPVGPRRR
jgi:type IV secretion system protein VirB9